MIQQTSIESYKEIKPKLGLLHRRVYAIIKEIGSISNQMISTYTGIPINIVTPRVYELRKKGLVLEDKKSYCFITGKKVIFWRVNGNSNYERGFI